MTIITGTGTAYDLDVQRSKLRETAVHLMTKLMEQYQQLNEEEETLNRALEEVRHGQIKLTNEMADLGTFIKDIPTQGAVPNLNVYLKENTRCLI